mgnify:CR=1 FL=1
MPSEQPATGTELCWDHEDCPRDDCSGELQQQDRFNVLCLSCEGVWTYVKTSTAHLLQTADCETVATKPIAMSDGGQSPGDARIGADVPTAIRRGGATRPVQKLDREGNLTVYRSHAVAFECQDCGNVQWFATDRFRFIADCHECGLGSCFEFDFELARSATRGGASE